MKLSLTNINGSSPEPNGDMDYKSISNVSTVKATRGVKKSYPTRLSCKISKDVQEIFEICDVEETPIMISGSSILHLLMTHSKKTETPSWSFKDYDLYFKNGDDREKVIDHVKNKYTYNRLHESKNGEVLEVNDYQLDFTKHHGTKRLQSIEYYGDKILGSDEIIGHFGGTIALFDIAACSVGIVRVGKGTSPKNCYLLTNKAFEESIKTRKLLKIHAPTTSTHVDYPKAVYRQWKYHKRGFEMSDMQILNNARGIIRFKEWFKKKNKNQQSIKNNNNNGII